MVGAAHVEGSGAERRLERAAKSTTRRSANSPCRAYSEVPNSTAGRRPSVRTMDGSKASGWGCASHGKGNAAAWRRTSSRNSDRLPVAPPADAVHLVRGGADYDCRLDRFGRKAFSPGCPLGHAGASPPSADSAGDNRLETGRNQATRRISVTCSPKPRTPTPSRPRRCRSCVILAST